MKYRIGEVADFFGMTKEGVRYLERQGIIESRRDESNGYRYFPREEITKMKLIRSYQAIGFTLEEAQEMLYHLRQEDVLERMEKKICVLEEKEEQIRRMKRMLMDERAAVETYFDQSHRFELVMRPAYWLFPRVSDEAGGMSPAEKAAIAEARQIEKQWIQAMPPVRLGALHNDRHGNRIEELFGSVVFKEQAEELGLARHESVIEIPQRLCLRGYIGSVLGERPDPKKMFDWIETNGLFACGDMFGVICCNSRDSKGIVLRLHEMYIPVCEKSDK